MRVIIALACASAVLLIPLSSYGKGGGHGGDGGNSSITGATAGGGPVGGSTTGSLGTPIQRGPSVAAPPAPYPPLSSQGTAAAPANAVNPGVPEVVQQSK